MASASPCPTPENLRDLLAGRLSAEQEAALTAHLDDCPRCRGRLEESVGGTRWLPDTSDWDPRAQPPIGRDLRRAMNRVLSSHGQSAAPSRGPVEPEALDFLDPPLRPGFLGQFGPYDVIERIGQGGMGIVLKAHDPMLNRTVAIKVLSPELAADMMARVRFLREAQSAAAVNHPHLVTIYTVDEANGLPYLVMEHVTGGSLKRRIDATGALEIDEVVRIGSQIASGLAAAHARGLVHRDIKPANVLLAQPEQQAKIADFGLAKATVDVSITQSGTLTGTPQYMAPEQARGEAADQRTDLFSFGSVLYAMCTGRAPFEAPTLVAVIHRLCEQPPTPLRQLNPKVPDWLAEIVARLLAKGPNERFQSAAEVAELLSARVPAGQQPPAPAIPRPRAGAEAAGRKVLGSRRGRWIAAAGAAAVVVALVAAAELTGLTSLHRLLVGPPVEPPRPGPSLPDRGFVLYAESAEPRAFASLADAVAAAGDRDVVEIRWNGQVAGEPVRITKPLTIRAAEGYRPVFETKGPRPSFHAQAAVLLEGLTFHLENRGLDAPRNRPGGARRPQRAAVLATDAPLFVANCRFVVLGPDERPGGAAIAAMACGLCEVRNCLLIGTAGPGVRWTCTGTDELVIHNSACAGLTPVVVRARAQRPARLRLVRSTFCGREAVLATAPVGPAGRFLDVRAVRSVFAVGSVLGYPDRLTGRLDRALAWKDEGNVFAVKDGFARALPIGGPSAERPEPSVRDLAGWNRLWQQDASGSRQVGGTFGAELVKKARYASERVSAADFRFPDARAGADVQWLGPGEPYDRWRKTPEYQAWLRRAQRPKGTPPRRGRPGPRPGMSR